MKNYEQIADSIIKKYDERLAERKRRKVMILRSLAVGLGAAAVLGVGLTTFALRPPKKPTSSQSGIIVETETTSAETTKQQTAETTTVTSVTASTSSVQTKTESTATTAASETTTETEVTTETDAPTETSARTKAPRTTSDFRTVNATWTEAVPLQPDPNIKKHAALRMFDPDEVYNNTDIVFDGTIIGSTEYEVCITDADGNSYTNRVTVLDVTVDYVYCGETDKALVKVLWKSSLPMQCYDIYPDRIVVGSEYIFMAQELCEEYPDISWAYRYADYELRSNLWYLIPAYGDYAGIYRGFYKDDEEALAMSLAKEDLIGLIPDRMTDLNAYTLFYKNDLIELLKKFFT